jgi:glycogen debranching enzyme
MQKQILELSTNRRDIERTFRLALADIESNIHPYKGGLVDGELVLGAGFDYLDPWTRDTAINIWNGAGLLYPEVTRNNLLATLTKSGNSIVLRDIPGSPEGNNNYWDAIIWVLGAWYYYVYTGDEEFLKIALPVIKNAFQTFEELEFNPEMGLFRGGGVYADGISAYPDAYAEPAWDHSDIGGWPERNPDRAHPKGTGLPMYTLSTNCVYAEAYRLAANIASKLDDNIADSWQKKASELKLAINRAFWMEDRGTYRYMIDPFGGSDHQEALGISFAILFRIADKKQTAQILDCAHITPNGIACVWPPFPRYCVDDKTFGRHCGTVWPFIQAFWAEAALTGGRKDLFEQEFDAISRLAFKSDGFYELYHPLTGEPYGGVQEGIRWTTWPSVPRQTWSATGYLRMILQCIFGMKLSPEGVIFKPYLPDGITSIRLEGLPYRKMVLNLELEGQGDVVKLMEINKQAGNFIPADAEGLQELKAVLGSS